MRTGGRAGGESFKESVDMFRVELWTVGDRGVTSYERPTKREANYLATQMRNDPNCLQTIIIFPNGNVRICRNTRAKAAR